MKKLLGYCPLLESEPCVLHDRALSAVVALGLFAVETELKVRPVHSQTGSNQGLSLHVPPSQSHGGEIVAYLVKLLRAVTKATSKWTQNIQVAAKNGLAKTKTSFVYYTGAFVDGLIAEQFCYKLCLILSNVSIFCEPELKDQVSG